MTARESGVQGMVAVFAGTVEGRRLCELLSAAVRPARAFVATEYGGELIEGLPGIDVRVGRLDALAMGGAIAGCSLVVDATHPYAVEASGNVRAAAKAAQIPYLRLVRPSTLSEGDAKDEGESYAGTIAAIVPDAVSAARYLEGVEGDVLLTTGSKDLPAYAAADGLAQRCWPRVLPDENTVRVCRELGFPESHVICMQGPFAKDLNVAMLRHCAARWLVTKDTGCAGGFPQKLEAAREAGARVVLIGRPDPDEEGLSLEETAALLDL